MLSPVAPEAVGSTLALHFMYVDSVVVSAVACHARACGLRSCSVLKVSKKQDVSSSFSHEDSALWGASVTDR